MSIYSANQITTMEWDNENQIVVCRTHDRKFINRLKKLVDMGNEDIDDRRVGPDGERVFTFPRSWIKVNPPRQVSEEVRQKMAEAARTRMNARWTSKERENG